MRNGVDAAHLPDASDVTNEDTAVAALSQVFASVNGANGELSNPRKDSVSGSNTGSDPDTKDLSDRLKEWLEKLHGTMKAIIHYLPHAASFSVTVGTTISVTMNFNKRYEEEILDKLSQAKR
jgi:hypothetical protein